MNQNNLNTPEYWDHVYKKEWESGVTLSDAYSRDYGPIHDAIIDLIPDGSHVIDVACGPGLLCRKIKQRVARTRVLGVDFSEYMISRNQELDSTLGVEYLHLDIRYSLSQLGRAWDVVTMCEILEHLEEPEQVVASAVDLLKPGGRLVLTCPHENEIPDPEHVRTWGHDELFHLLAPYSSTISFMHFPPPWFHVWMLVFLSKKPVGSPQGEVS